MKKPIYFHTNTEFSFLQSTIKMNSLFEEVLKNEIDHIALTDVENLYGLPQVWEFAKKNGKKAIIGIELNLERATIIVIAKNFAGYQKINKIIFDRSKGENIELASLEDPNVIIIDHAQKGFYAQNLMPQKMLSNFYWNGKNPILNSQTLYVPTKKVITLDDNQILHYMRKIGNHENDNHTYLDFYDAQDFQDVSDSVYAQMLDVYGQIEAFEISSEIKMAIYDENPQKELEKLIYNDRYEALLKRYSKEEVDQRIAYEISVISSLKFENYFLIIQDVLNFARQQKIYVGPGRGSASGSLISYLLKITSVNPLEYDLLFERFLNVDRISLPDIDIDIQDDRRDELLEYIKNKYGSDKCGLITTFQTLALKGSLRDVGRVMNVPIPEIDLLSNSISKFDTSLEEAYLKNKKYKILIDKLEQRFPNFHYIASKIEGFPRQKGIHAAGVIICNQPLYDVVPYEASDNTLNQVQFSMDYLERYGLIKIDFLGLKNLSLIEQIEKLIPKKEHFDNLINQSYSLFNDQRTFSMLNNLKTLGVFQLESEGMTNAIKDVRIDSFEDIYAIISLFRPGPMQYIQEYAKNKQNPSLINKIHQLYDEIVLPTYGIIVYQEQIMQIAQKVAGMSFAQADLLRRAISKKDETKLHSYKQIFFEGGLKNNINEADLENIYANIEKFAQYGFNKSHAVAYAFISYKLAYYKARFPKQFYKVLLTNASSDLQSIRKYVNEANSQGIKVFSPLINYSSRICEINENGVFLPLIMIKGIGEVACRKIILEIARGGIYQNFFDAYLRMRLVGIGESNIETLIKASAFRQFDNTETLLKNMPMLQSIYEMLESEIKLKKASDKFAEYNLFVERNKIFEIQMTHYEDDLNEIIKYESTLLGSPYNASITGRYEKDVKLANLKENQYEFLYVYLSKVTKNSKDNMIATISDSSKSVVAYGFSDNVKDLVNFNKPRVIVVGISKSSKGYYIIKSWEELKEDEK